MNGTLQAITAFEQSAIVAGQARLHTFAAARIERTASIRTARAVATAQADAMQSSMEAWLETVYADLRYHVHPLTCAILIPCPWSRSHHRAYGLSEQQGRLLAALVTDVVNALPERRRCIEFDGVNRWLLNLSRFPTLQDAHAWLRGPCQITASTVLEGWRKYPGGRRDTGRSTGQVSGRSIGFGTG